VIGEANNNRLLWAIMQTDFVIGISLTFMAVDMLGGIFSCLSLAFRPEFDGVAAATYVAVVVRMYFVSQS